MINDHLKYSFRALCVCKNFLFICIKLYSVFSKIFEEMKIWTQLTTLLQIVKRILLNCKNTWKVSVIQMKLVIEIFMYENVVIFFLID